MKAVIYIAHGSRRQAANQHFITFINEAANEKFYEYGFLEHAEPSVQQAVDDCIQKGATDITIVPVFLSSGVHVTKDIPAEILEARKEHPSISFHYSHPLGTDQILVKILKDRLLFRGFEKSENEAVLLVGHGSRKQEVALELQKLANDLEKEIEWKVNTAFITTPIFYHEKVEELLSYQKIYILPFLLFTGGFTVKMEKELSEYREKVIFCDAIGFDKKLIPLLQKRAE
ncbi:MAG: sirohydrochlorin chelatase [Bacillota bacterium]|nr:sirohydrochlorin chelatase [Bacillota bacterium]